MTIEKPKTVADKPSLHEIAAMLFPHSRDAMRKHYNAEWGKFYPDGETLCSFKVQVNFSYREEDSRTYTVEAYSEDEAKDLAEHQFDRDRTIDHTLEVEVDDVEVREVSQ